MKKLPDQDKIIAEAFDFLREYQPDKALRQAINQYFGPKEISDDKFTEYFRNIMPWFRKEIETRKERNEAQDTDWKKKSWQLSQLEATLDMKEMLESGQIERMVRERGDVFDREEYDYLDDITYEELKEQIKALRKELDPPIKPKMPGGFKLR